jgi:hypothetical protein
MLSLDRQRPARGGRRPGQHARHPADQGRVHALAAMRRYDAPASGRLLTRLARTMLARKGPSAG